MKKFTLSLEEGEVAIPIEGYEGRYVVTDLGRIFSLLSGKFLKGWSNGHGYLCVTLCDGHSEKKFTIHRLVANSFKIPGWDDPNLEVDHINDDNTDNRLVNLQMLTHEQNLAKRDREKMKLAIRNSTGITRSKPCVCIETGEFYWSTHEAARAIGRKNNAPISNCCLGHQPTAYGYHWRYATEEEIQAHL